MESLSISASQKVPSLLLFILNDPAMSIGLYNNVTDIIRVILNDPTDPMWAYINAFKESPVAAVQVFFVCLYYVFAPVLNEKIDITLSGSFTNYQLQSLALQSDEPGLNLDSENSEVPQTIES